VIRLTQLAVAKRSVTMLLTVAFLLGGLFAWSQLKEEFLPDVQLPYIVVITPMPGASAQDVATSVTEPIERAIGSVARLQHVDSSSLNSVSIVVAAFTYGTNVKDTKATIDADVKALGLPSGAVAQVSSFDLNAQAPLTVAISAKGSTTAAQLNELAAKTIVPSLEGVDGVSSVDLTGAIQKQLVISLNPTKLATNGVTITQIQGVLQANNLILPAGSLPQTDLSIPVSAQHEFTSAAQISALIVGMKLPAPGLVDASGKAPAPTPVTIGDLVNLPIGTSDAHPTGYATVDGSPAIVLAISKSSDANTVQVVADVQARLAKLSKDGSFTVSTIEDLSTFITDSRDSLVREGALGALFAIITIFLFLMSLRSTLVAAVSIPLSIMAALVLMLVAGVSVNIMTLGGLAIAVGRVVDDAIVVLENIYRHRGRGDPMREACISGTREVASAITSSTLTTVAVFLPLGFVGGIVSQFFLPFALTVTFALIASLICALTVVPVLASLFIDRIKLDPDESPTHKDTLVQRIYTPLLAFALRSSRTRWAVLGIAGVLVIGAGMLVPHIPTQFLNAGSQKFLTISVAPPSGTPSESILDVANTVTAQIRGDKDVTLIEATVPGDGDTGNSGMIAAFTGSAPNTATILVGMSSSVDLDAKQKQYSASLDKVAGTGWTVEVSQQSLTGSSGIGVVVSGTDPANVAAATNAIMAVLRGPDFTTDLINVKSDLAVQTPEIVVAVDPNKAFMAGTTTAQLQGEIHNALVGTKIGTVNLTTTGPTDVYLRVDVRGLNSVGALGTMPVGATGVPLNTVATVTQGSTQARVTRVDQSPAATISADTVNKDTGGISLKIQKQIDALTAAGKLPGVTVTLSGVTEQMNTAFAGLFVAMAVAILLVYIVMVLVFDSLVDPLVIMFSLPLATIGAFPALFITQRAIGISALIGFLMLIGIVVTNAIVLLDLVEQHRRRGMPMREALMQGGRTRVRPILMTAIATMLALMPLALGLSEGEIIASELATVVIGGLFTSTFLTLIIVPVVYSLVDDAKVRAREARGVAPEPIGEAAQA
jgi:hydrophobic/amphiphilic exporter-1 (mainly G- bacteria), HAE1 family